MKIRKNTPWKNTHGSESRYPWKKASPFFSSGSPRRLGPIFMALFISLMILPLVAPVRNAAADTYTVTSIGDWNADDPGTDTLAGALRTLTESTDTITLGNSLTGEWLNWPSVDTYTLFAPTTPLSTDATLTITMGGRSLSGTNLDLVSGSGAYAFSGGTLGSTGYDLGIGATGDASVTFDTMSILAKALQVGSDSSVATATFTNSTIVVSDSFSAEGFGTKITLDNASSLTTGDFSLAGGAAFISGGATTISGNLTVGGAGSDPDPDSDEPATLSASSFSGSGTLTFDGTFALKVTEGGKVDLSNFTFTPGQLESGSSILVDGVFAHKESGQSLDSQLIWSGDLDVSGGSLTISGGGNMSGVGNIRVGNGSTLEVSGAVLDADSGEEYRSTLTAGGSLQLGGAGTMKVRDGALVTGLKAITIGGDGAGAGTLNIEGTDVATGAQSEVSATGGLTLGAGGALNITEGGKLGAVGGTFSGGAKISVSGLGVGEKRSTLSLSGALVANDAEITVTDHALFAVTGSASLGNAEGKKTSLKLGSNAAFTTGAALLVGNEGNADVTISGGTVRSDGETILGKEASSFARVTMTGGYWYAGGEPVAPGLEGYTAPSGKAVLDVESGLVTVSGLFAMAGDGETSGLATFGSGAELHMRGDGSFINMNTHGFETGTSKGKITFKGSLLSGSGHVYAGEQVTGSGVTIAPGSRWMYDFNRTDDDKLTSLGTLHIHDDAALNTVFTGARFRTELDRGKEENNTDGLSDQLVVHGNLVLDENFSVDISRPLDGSYLLVSTEGGTISGYTGKSLASLADGSLLLNLNGKLLKGNERIDYSGGMATRLEKAGTADDPSDEIWLDVKTTSGGNVITYWTGNETRGEGDEAKQVWDMTAQNFAAMNKIGEVEDGEDGRKALDFTGKDQFLDGDIVVFDFAAVTDAAKRTVSVTTDATNYSGDRFADMGSVPANVRVAEVHVLGGIGSDNEEEEDTFTWKGGSIFALDSALYTTLDQGAGQQTPSGKLVKIGAGTLLIQNANEFYGGIHLGEAGTTGGKIVLQNEKGLGTYNSATGYKTRGLVFVHEDTTLDATAIPSVTNRFIVDKELTFLIDKGFSVKGNNALGDDIYGGKGAGIYIREGGEVAYKGGTLKLTGNLGKQGGGIYTEADYTLGVPSVIEKNFVSGQGGGIYAEGSFKLRDGSTVDGNRAQSAGGGIYVGYKEGKGRDFVIHGNTTILNNLSGGETGGGIFVDAGRALHLSTGAEGDVKGGDIWFEGNYARVGFDPHNPSSGTPDKEKAIRNALHLSNKEGGGSPAATLTVSGPYNTYFYDALTGDAGTEIKIQGVGATASNTSHTLPETQYGTVIFHADSAFYGDTTVSGGATFRLENSTENAGTENPETVEALFGRKASLAPGETGKSNTFTLDNDSFITGQGTITADKISLNGTLDLDTGTFSKPDDRDGSGAIASADKKTQGILKLEGDVEVADTARWNLNLGAGNKTDTLAVTGEASFTGSTPGEKLTLEIDEIVRGKYAVMTTTGGVSGFNTEKTKSDAKVYLGDSDTNLATIISPAEAIFSRLRITTYVEDKNLYLDVTGRNRHVTLTENSNWGYDDTWTFGTGFTPDGLVSGSWRKNDSGPDTSVYLDGDMVTISGPIAAGERTATLTSNVRPVDLFVTGTNNRNVTIGGDFGITTYSTTGTGSYGPNGTTIHPKGSTETNDYGIPYYTGMLHKSGVNTLTFANGGTNTFTEGIAFDGSGNAGTISFGDVRQLVVGSGKAIDFEENGILLYTGNTEGTLGTTDLAAGGADVRIAAGKTATFNISNAAGQLNVSGQIRGLSDTVTTGSIVKTGAGTLKVSGANTFTGGTSFRQGSLKIGNDMAFGAWTSGSANAGLITVTNNFGEVKKFIVGDSYTVSNRFDVLAGSNNGLEITIADGKTFTMAGYKTTGTQNGGAINVASSSKQLAFTETSGSLVIEGNSAASGGGIYTLSGSDLIFSPSTTFTGNTATASGGGLHAASNVIFNKAASLTGNTAGTSGGGIYSGGNVSMTGNDAKTISGNTAGTSGGGIYATGDVVISGNGAKTISNNTATAGSGGAIYAKNISLTGPATISNNTANATSGQGGAFYLAGGTLTLTPTEADDTITFSGNKAPLGEAVYLDRNADMVVSGAGDVIFYDTVASSTSRRRGAEHLFTKEGSGTVMFGKEGSEVNNSLFYGKTTVNEGTFRIVDGVSFGGKRTSILHPRTTFTLNDGASLTGGGKLTANTFTWKGEIAPDASTGLTVDDEDLKIGTLTLDGNTTVSGNNNPNSWQLNIDLQQASAGTVGLSDMLVVDGTLSVQGSNKVIVNLHNYKAGNYLLIKTEGLSLRDDFAGKGVNGIGGDGAFDILIHTAVKTDRHKVAFVTGDKIEDAGTHGTTNTNDLWITTEYNNLYMYWTGTNKGDGAANIWQQTRNEENGNWTDGNTSEANRETHFEGGDTVVFADSIPYAGAPTPANKAIRLGSDVVVTDMIVDTAEAAYIFAGDFGITTTDTYSGDKLDAKYGANASGTDAVPQTLTKKGSGTLTFTNGLAASGNTFSGGIVFDTKNEVDNAGTIAFNRANQLGDGGKGITFKENGTLQANAALTLENNFHIAAGKTATFDTQNNNVTHSGKIDEVGNTGSGNFVKSGTGTLTLTNKTNDWQGTTTISGGTLKAVGVGTLGPAQNSVVPTTRTITNNATLEVEIADSTSETLSQIIAGTGAVVKSGVGTLTLDQKNTYTGNTTITGGTLIAEGIAALGTDAAGKQVSSTTGGILELKLSSNETLLQLLAGDTGTGMNLVKSGAGTLTINRANSYIGTTVIEEGKVLITNVAGLGNNATARTVTMATDTELEIALSAAGTFNKKLTGDGKLTKSGTGTLTLTNANDFTGGTTLSDGGLNLTNVKALGTYPTGTTNSGGTLAVSGTGRTLNFDATGTFQNRINIGSNAGLKITNSQDTVIGNVVNADNIGGAVYVDNNGVLELNNDYALTFSGNKENTNDANDILLGGTNAQLNITGTGNTFFGSGIRGTGTVTKTGTGLTQIGAASSIEGSTTINAGRFRVNNGSSYTNTGEGNKFELVSGTLEGKGTITAPTITITGNISPDSDTLGATKTEVEEGKRFGTLTLSGDTVNLGSSAQKFSMDYDLGTAYSGTGEIPTDNDLLRITDATTVTLHGGNINFRGSLQTGTYLVVDSNQTITIKDGATLDGINHSNGVLTATLNGSSLVANSPRYGLEYLFEDDTARKQIWLDVEHNTLTMDWKNTASTAKWNVTDENWQSKQWDSTNYAKTFNNGDYVNFTGNNASGQTIEIASDVVVSGMTFGGANNITFTGDGGILSRIQTTGDTMITGKFVDTANTTYVPKVVPDGKLQKSGTGTLTFANGANTFNKGIEINAGTIAFNRANQLGDGGKGITFKENGTLQANADLTLGNNFHIANDKTATFNTNGYNVSYSGKIDEVDNTGSGNFVKSGDGTLTLTEKTNDWQGTTTISGGMLKAVGVGTLGLAKNSVDTTRTITNNATLEVEIADSTSETLSQIIAGTGAVVKSGTGTLTLDQNNTYSGGTTVTAGRLIAETLGSAGSNVTTGVVNIGTGTVFELKLDASEGGTFSQQMTGAGKFVKSGEETLTLGRSDNDYTGNTEVTGGSIKITNVGAVGSNIAGGTVNMSGTGTSLEMTLASDGTFNQKITGIGELVQTGTGMLTLSNTNTFTGGTEWNGGNIHLTNNAGLSATGGVAGSKSGFVFVNDTATLSTDTADNTLKNRFEVAAGKTLTFGNELTISGNSVKGADGAAVNGGAIELKEGAGFTSSSPLHLTGNATDGDGGAVYAPTENIIVGGIGDNTLATLTGNAAKDGGGLYAASVSVKGQASGTTISGNTASGDGGAFYLVGGTSAAQAVSELDSTLGSITLSGNKSSFVDTTNSRANAIHMNQYVTLNIKGEHEINLEDGITSRVGSTSGNTINIDLEEGAALNISSVSDYYGNTNFRSGLMNLADNSRFGKVADDNIFTQKTGAILAGSGTISAKEMILGGTINAGTYASPRVANISTLKFVGETKIGEFGEAGGAKDQTRMNIDLDTTESQTADLMDITGGLAISGTSGVDFNTFASGKFLIVQTTGGVTGHTDGGIFRGENAITDFSSTIAGLSLNPSRFEIVYTLENGDKDIYANLGINNIYIIWTGANASHDYDSEAWNFVGDSDYDNKWLNDPLYNWHHVDKAGLDHITRFRQGDHVAFVGNDSIEMAQTGYETRRENIEIITHETDDDPDSGDSVARVADMLVTSGGTYRFTGRGIEAYSDQHTTIEDALGQLYVSGGATAIFANAANNFQRGIVLQNGAVGFNNPDQLGTVFVDDPYNKGVTASHGITVEGENSYGILYANADNMTLGIVINIDKASSEMVINTDGNNFGDSGVTGNYTLTLTHAAIDGHTVPDALGETTPINGIYGKGRLVKTGNGTLILAAENTYEGGTLVEKGTLAIAADNRLGKAGTPVLLDSGTLRAMDSFGMNRALFISEKNGTVEVDGEKTFTLSGLIRDADKDGGIGNLLKTGRGTLLATNTANGFEGDLDVQEGRFVAVGLGTLGAEIATRKLITKKGDDGTLSQLELRVTGDETLVQQLAGDGEVLKTGTGRLTLDTPDEPSEFEGVLTGLEGSIHLTGDFGKVGSFSFLSGSMLTGYGTLGAEAGGVFESGSILRPGNLAAGDPAVNPTSKAIHVAGSVTFAPGSLYQVLITQYEDPTYDPENSDRMRPVNDSLLVTDGGLVTIGAGALLGVEIDYWADNLSPYDFGEDTSGRWTIIDAEGGLVNNPDEIFTLLDMSLPRGVELMHGWAGSLYQLWLVGNPKGNFENLGKTHNQTEIGKNLDQLVDSRDKGLKELIELLSDREKTDAQVLRDLDQLHGDLFANAMLMAMKKPWRHPFKRLNFDRPLECLVSADENPETGRKPWQSWAEIYGRYDDVDSDGNAHGFTVDRMGVVLGADKVFSDRSVLGVNFNYSEAKLSQSTGKAELEDYEIGVYGLTRLGEDFELKGYLGYSWQDYDLTRRVRIPGTTKRDGIRDNFKTNTDGKALAASVEVSRPFCEKRFGARLAPFAAMDYEKVWVDGYTEKGGITALSYEDSNFYEWVIRAGMDMEYAPSKDLDIRARIQYAYRLNGNDHVYAGTRFAKAETREQRQAEIRGVDLGSGYLNLATGLAWNLNEKGTLSLFADYDLDLYEEKTSHTGQIGFTWQW